MNEFSRLLREYFRSLGEDYLDFHDAVLAEGGAVIVVFHEDGAAEHTFCLSKDSAVKNLCEYAERAENEKFTLVFEYRAAVIGPEDVEVRLVAMSSDRLRKEVDDLIDAAKNHVVDLDWEVGKLEEKGQD